MAKRTPKGNATQGEIGFAEYLYTEKNVSPQAIAEELGRNIKTIYDWRDKYNWDETKNLFTTAPSELKKILLQAAMRVMKGEERKDDKGNPIKEVDADALSKIMKAYDYISKKANPAVCSDVLMELDFFVSKQNPKLAAENTQYHRLFLMHKINQENGN